MAKCSVCHGAGSITTSKQCTECPGTGEILGWDKDGNERLEMCPHCEYGLIYAEEVCRFCNGKGEA
jgi:RecJ-like exonuclease